MERQIDQVMFNGKRVDDFTCGYVTAMLWSSTDDSGSPMDDRFTWEDIAPDAMADIIADCERFQRDHQADIESDLERAGIDFWLTRNHHGAGFWDGDWPHAGERLTEASHRFGERDLYVGDDGKLHL